MIFLVRLLRICINFAEWWGPAYKPTWVKAERGNKSSRCTRIAAKAAPCCSSSMAVMMRGEAGLKNCAALAEDPALMSATKASITASGDCLPCQSETFGQPKSKTRKHFSDINSHAF